MRQQDDSILEVIRILVLLQGAVAVVSTIEVLIVGALGGPLVSVIFLTGGATALTLACAPGVVRRSRRARKTLVILQVLWLAMATIDLLLAIFLAQRGFELVPTLTRIVLPYAIFRMLRRPHVRDLFDVRQSRRRRRRIAAAESNTEAILETSAA